MATSIVSRALAILILAIPAGYIVHELDTHDREVIQSYSHEELLAHLESMRLPSLIVTIMVTLLVGTGFTACVETIAWLLRFLLTRGQVVSSPTQQT